MVVLCSCVWVCVFVCVCVTCLLSCVVCVTCFSSHLRLPHSHRLSLYRHAAPVVVFVSVDPGLRVRINPRILAVLSVHTSSYSHRLSLHRPRRRAGAECVFTPRCYICSHLRSPCVLNTYSRIPVTQPHEYEKRIPPGEPCI